MDPALSEGYETSRRMQRRHDPTYYFATRRLPAELRPATHALYGYVRTADQIVDGPRRPATPDGRRAALDAWEAELEAGRRRSPQPIVRALADAAARHRLPLGELRTYMRSMRIDCAPVRIATWEELVAYMDGSAGSVGRIMAALLGVPARHHADLGRLGLAFQLANFIRDVREDRRLDRVYLPAEDRARFGVSEARPGAPSAPARAARAARPRGRARPRACSRARARRSPPRPPPCARASASRPACTAACSTASRRRTSTCSAPTGVRVWHIPGAALEAIRVSLRGGGPRRGGAR